MSQEGNSGDRPAGQDPLLLLKTLQLLWTKKEMKKCMYHAVKGPVWVLKDATSSPCQPSELLGNYF